MGLKFHPFPHVCVYLSSPSVFLSLGSVSLSLSLSQSVCLSPFLVVSSCALISPISPGSLTDCNLLGASRNLPAAGFSRVERLRKGERVFGILIGPVLRNRGYVGRERRGRSLQSLSNNREAYSCGNLIISPVFSSAFQAPLAFCPSLLTYRRAKINL